MQGMEGMTGTIVWLVVMVAIFYFMLIRPENKRKKQVKAMLDALKVGDTVTTIGGIIGKVLKVKDDKVCIEIGDRTSKHPMTLKREAIATVVPCKNAKKEANVELMDEAPEAGAEANAQQAKTEE